MVRVTLGIAVTVIGIDQHRERRSVNDLSQQRRFFAETIETDIRHRVSRSFRSESADLVGLESGALDQTRVQGVIRCWQQEWTLPLQNRFPRTALNINRFHLRSKNFRRLNNDRVCRPALRWSGTRANCIRNDYGIA